MRKAFICTVLAAVGQANAGSFAVSPVRIFFEPRDRAVAVTITNEGNTEVALQADVNAWSQDAKGEDKLELTDDMILSIPSLKLAPGAKQVVRLALVAPRDPTQQMTYRLIMREIPEALPSKPGAVELPIALVLSMPVFVTPPGAKRDVNCTLTLMGNKEMQSNCANTGNAYAQLRNVELRRGEDVLATSEGVMYVLPGARKSLPLKSTNRSLPTSGPAQLHVMFDDGKQQSFSVNIP